MLIQQEFRPRPTTVIRFMERLLTYLLHLFPFCLIALNGF